MSGHKRRSYDAGHRPKFLAVVDETPECARAVHFAARRSARTGASLVLLSVVSPPDSFEWLGVGDVLRAEGEEAAAKLLAEAAKSAREAAGIEPETAVRTGDKPEEIAALIQEDEDISFLVLAAASGKDGPGPLVAAIAGKSSTSFVVPIVIVPGDLTDEEIDALAG